MKGLPVSSTTYGAAHSMTVYLRVRYSSVIDRFKRLRENPETENNNHVKVVQGEEELVDHVESGWSLIKELNHEKYLIKLR